MKPPVLPVFQVTCVLSCFLFNLNMPVLLHHLHTRLLIYQEIFVLLTWKMDQRSHSQKAGSAEHPNSLHAAATQPPQPSAQHLPRPLNPLAQGYKHTHCCVYLPGRGKPPWAALGEAGGLRGEEMSSSICLSSSNFQSQAVEFMAICAADQLYALHDFVCLYPPVDL